MNEAQPHSCSQRQSVGHADGLVPNRRGRTGRPAWPLRLATGSLLTAALAGCVVVPPRARSGPSPQPGPAVTAAPMYFYPVQGQSDEQLDRDRYACYRWASDQTGASPGMTPIRAGAPVATADQGEPRRSERQGALAGAVIGAAAGAAMSPGRHAAGNAVLGAIFGAAVGTMAGVQQDRARAVQAAPSAAYGRAGVPDDFRRAMSACMAGRGYRVG